MAPATSRMSNGDAVWIRRTLVLLVIAGLALFLWGTINVLLIAFGAVLFSILLSSLANLVSVSFRISRRWALSVVIVLIVLAFAGMGWLFGSHISGQFGELESSLPSNLEKIRQELQASAWGRFLTPQFARSMDSIVTRTTEVLSSGLGLIIDFVVVLFGGIYLAAEPQLYRSGVLQLVPRTHRHRAEQFLDATYDALRQWLLGQLIAMVAIGILAGVGLSLLGIPSAATLGLITALTEFMPVLGPVIGAVPAVIVAFGEGPRMAVYAVTLYFIIQQLESNLLIPLIQEKMVSLPPALTLFADIVFGLLFGLAGLLLATPITVVGMLAVRMLYVEDVLSDRIGITES